MPDQSSPPQHSFVLLNVFEVEPENVQALLAVLEDLTLALRTEPGFISATFHVSLDQTRIFNYAVYQGSPDEFLSVLKQNPEHQKHIHKCFALSKGNQRTFAYKAFTATKDSFESHILAQSAP